MGIYHRPYWKAVNSGACLETKVLLHKSIIHVGPLFMSLVNITGVVGIL